MATSFETVYDVFFKRVVNDPDFFYYINITDAEAEELIKEKAFDYMIESIATILEYSTPDIDFNDYDETLEEFAEDLTKQEIQLISNCMFEKFLERDFAKLRIYNKYFTTSEVSMFSPANERKTFLDMFDFIQKKNVKAIRSYNSRDRLTNQLKSYGGASY